MENSPSRRFAGCTATPGHRARPRRRAFPDRVLLTRFIGPNDRPWTITLYSMLAFLIGSSIASVLVFSFGGALVTDNPSLQFVLRPWVVPKLEDCLLMVFLGLNAAVGFYCLIKAYWVSPASTVAPFEYTYIIWAVLFGYLIWSEIPRATTMIPAEERSS